MAVYDRIFNAVFPPSSDLDVPTPTATPLLGSSAFGQSFGSLLDTRPRGDTSVSKQIDWDRAWHTATAFLSLKDEPIRTEESEQDLKRRWIKPLTAEIRRALENVLLGDISGSGLQFENGSKDDLLRWYFEEAVVEHYIKHVLPTCKQVSQEHRQIVKVKD